MLSGHYYVAVTTQRTMPADSATIATLQRAWVPQSDNLSNAEMEKSIICVQNYAGTCAANGKTDCFSVAV